MKSKQKLSPSELVVEEIRDARRKLWKQAGGTFKGLSRLVAKISEEHFNGRTNGQKRSSRKS